MRQENLTFNSECDTREVDQFGFVDLHDAAVNGSIPATLEAQEAKFNHIENPSSLRARPDDTFSALRAERAYAEFVRKSDKDASSE